MFPAVLRQGDSMIGTQKHQMDFRSVWADGGLEPAVPDTAEYALGSIVTVGVMPNIDRLDDPFICIDELSSSIASIRALIDTREGIIAVVNRPISAGWEELEARARKRWARFPARANLSQPRWCSAGSVQWAPRPAVAVLRRARSHRTRGTEPRPGAAIGRPRGLNRSTERSPTNRAAEQRCCEIDGAVCQVARS